MNPSGDGGRGLTATGLFCGSCGTELPPNSKFCKECGAPLTQATSAEYKQVTVLFADVVHSMYIASMVGAERLREIMAELVNITTAVVKRYGGTVDKFTGDGIMAVFGAPLALEDHAVRACLAALEIQDELARLAAQVRDHDGVELALRIGLNSGQVIAGEVGSASLGYTTMGEQVGVAQRMESVAPPGGVMLSASTARLVDGAAALSEPESVRIRGADEGVPVCRLLGMREDRTVRRAESNLVGRRWEMAAVEGVLDRSIDGHGAVVGVVGPPGIGKSRLVRELSAIASARGVEVFTTFCESHTSQIPFHAVARLLRVAFGVEGLDTRVARDGLRDRITDADAEDLLLLDDLLGITDPDVELPKIDPDARRRRLTALVNAISLARESPAVYVVEDAHWIDEVSESMLVDFLTVIPQMPSLMLLSYRPEYDGALTRMHGAQTIALAPLSDSETAVLVSGLLGPDASVGGLGQAIAAKAAGNPFFAEEIVRELAERGVLRGQPGAYVGMAETAEVTVPATLQATIAARIDRLDPKAKRTLSAAAVIGSRFGMDLLTGLGIEPVVDDLVAAQLIDQVRFTRQPEYGFHHPLIRAVAYEAQLKSDRAELHRRLAAAIEARAPVSADENAALIAEHLESAGDLRAAYSWHMRAGAWSQGREIAAALVSWDRAARVADQLSADDPDRLAMRIAPRTLSCAHGWRIHKPIAGKRFQELQDLCAAAGDKASVAIAMAGLLEEHLMNGRPTEASRLVNEQMALIESVGDPTLTVGLAVFPASIKIMTGEIAEALRLSNMVIDLAEGDRARGRYILGSPLATAYALRGTARWMLGRAGWREDFNRAVAMARDADPISQAAVIAYTYSGAIASGVIVADDAALRDIDKALQSAERSADDIALGFALYTTAIALLQLDSAQRERGLDLCRQLREMAVGGRYFPLVVPVIDVWFAEEMIRRGDRGAVALLNASIDEMYSGELLPYWVGATTVLVEALLDGGTGSDVQDAEAAVNRLATLSALDGWAYRDLILLRLRTLLARTRGDEVAYRDFGDRYRDMARSLGFEGHIKWAEAMP